MSRRSAARRGAVAGACAGFLWLAGSGLCDAAERTWTFAGNAFFSDATRWSPNAIPGAADNARFNLANTYSILFATNPTNTLASITDGDVTFSLGGETYTLTSTGSTSLVVGSKSSFPSVLAKLTVSGGTLADQSASIGNGLFGPGQITVGSATWTNAGAISVGAGSAGTLLINAGGGVTDVNASIGASSTGSATIGGSGASWTTSGALDIGVASTGQVTINTGGTITDSSSTTDAILGDSASGHGTLNITGGAFNVPNAGLRIGNSGLGTLSVSSGAGTSLFLYGGFNAGSSGTINVSGSGSLNVTDSAFIGGTSAASGGTAVLNINGAAVNIANQLKLWNGGVVNLSSGTLSVGNLALAGGTFNWTGGRLKANLTIDPVNIASLTVGAGQVLEGTTEVGSAAGAGTLNIVGGGSVTFLYHVSAQSSVNLNASKTELVHVYSGSVSLVNSATIVNDAFLPLREISVGADARVDLDHSAWTGDVGVTSFPLVIGQSGGSGTVTLSNGSTETLSYSSIALGSGSGSSGAITLDASKWGNYFEGYVSGPCHVGAGGPGWLTLQHGGVFESAQFIIGGAGGGTVTVSDSSNLGGNGPVQALLVGDHGNGTLLLTNGSTASGEGSMEIGQFSGSFGTISIDASSLVFGLAELTVGGAGTGLLSITGAGTAQFDHAYIGRSAGGVGTVNLTDAGSGWTAVKNVDVGQGQSGLLSAGPGTALNVGGTLTIYANGRLNLNAATFTASALNFNGGIGTIGIDAGGPNHNQPITIAGATSDVTFAAPQHLGTLTLNAGHARLAGGVLVTPSLSITPAAAQLDLGNGAMIVDYAATDPIASIQSWLTTGFAGGSWNGNGIASSTAAMPSSLGRTGLGYAEAGTIFTMFPATFAGESVDSSAVLVRYTYYGDANLDGTVNTLDFNALANHFDQSGKRWSDGDSNYDGIVNALDFNALATNFGSTLALPALGSVIPEPATIAAIGMIALLCRRRRVVGRIGVEPYHPARG